MKCIELKKILLFIVMILGISCKKGLEEDPRSFLATSNFYKTSDDAIAAVNAAYTMSNDLVFLPYMVLTDLPADDMTLPAAASISGQYAEMDNFTYTSNNALITTVWQDAYLAISRANIVLGRVPGISMDEKLKNRVLGEARFLRAFYYFRLVRLWGRIPLVLTETTNLKDIYPKQAEIADVYKQIIEDLSFAQQNLDAKYAYGSVNYGRATAGAAKSLLANVYMTMTGFPLKDDSKLQPALSTAKEVVENKSLYGYDLVPTYAAIFDYTKENTNSEMVFYAMAYSGYPATSRYFSRMYQNYKAYTYSPTTEIRAPNVVYQSADLRFRVNVTTLNQIGKYWDTVHGADAGNDFPLMRYTEVVLIYAESLIDAGGTANLAQARDLINLIRKRANVTLITATDQESLRSALRTERRLEFAFESIRYFDLIRWGTLVSTMKALGKNSVNDFNVLLPLPQREMNSNANLVQNKGY